MNLNKDIIQKNFGDNVIINENLSKYSWFNLGGPADIFFRPKNKDNFNEYILEKGILFEENIVKYINDNIHPVVKVSEYITSQNCEQTLYLMKNGTPIIHSAPVINNYNKKNNRNEIIL